MADLHGHLFMLPTPSLIYTVIAFSIAVISCIPLERAGACRVMSKAVMLEKTGACDCHADQPTSSVHTARFTRSLGFAWHPLCQVMPEPHPRCCHWCVHLRFCTRYPDHCHSRGTEPDIGHPGRCYYRCTDQYPGRDYYPPSALDFYFSKRSVHFSAWRPRSVME